MHWGILSTVEGKLEELDMIGGNNALGDSIYTRGETGRVGRDGWQSEAIIFMGKEDSIQVK